MVKRSLIHGEIKVLINGECLGTQIILRDRLILVWSVYIPANALVDDFKQFLSFIGNYDPKTPMILAGDFNCRYSKDDNQPIKTSQLMQFIRRYAIECCNSKTLTTEKSVLDLILLFHVFNSEVEYAFEVQKNNYTSDHHTVTIYLRKKIE